MLTSLRSRLLVGTVAATALLLALTGVVIYTLTRELVLGEFDKDLGLRARIIAFSVVGEQGRLKLVYNPILFPEYERRTDAEYYQLWQARSGRTMAASPSLAGSRLDQIAGPQSAPEFRTVVLPDGRRGRLAGVRFMPRDADGGTPAFDPEREMVLVVAKGLDEIERNLGWFRWLLIATCGLAIVASAGVLTGVVSRLLRPLALVARRIAGVEAADLAKPFHAGTVPDELRPVVDRIDELLRRLEAVFAREKAFTSDVAHELRTPLSGLRMTIEVMLAKPREATAYQEAMAECLGICGQMQALVDNLLALARLEADKVAVERGRVAIGDLLAECWRPFAGRARDRGVRLDWRVDETAVLATDREKVRLVISNLFDNAVSYVDQGGTITVSTPAAGERGFTVENTGSALPAEQVPRIFDRFWRGDRSRTAAGVHCGLGLALCRKLVDLLGGSIQARSAEGGTFAIDVRLPGDLPERRQTPAAAAGGSARLHVPRPARDRR